MVLYPRFFWFPLCFHGYYHVIIFQYAFYKSLLFISVVHFLGRNISSITRLSEGRYRINFQNQISGDFNTPITKKPPSNFRSLGNYINTVLTGPGFNINFSQPIYVNDITERTSWSCIVNTGTVHAHGVGAQSRDPVTDTEIVTGGFITTSQIKSYTPYISVAFV